MMRWLRTCAALILIALAIVAPDAAAESGVAIHSWHDYGVEGVEPFVWSDVALDSIASAEAEAERLAPLIRERPAAALFLKGAGVDLLRSRVGAQRYQVIRDGGYVEPTCSAMRAFADRLAALKARPARVVLDYEQGVSIWHFRGDDDPRRLENRAAFVEASRDWLGRPGADAAEFRNYEDGPEAYWAQYQRWAHERRAALLRDAVVEPLWAALGADLPVSNYGDRDREGLQDFNGAPMYSAWAGNDASPFLYVRSGPRLTPAEAELQTHQLIDRNRQGAFWVGPPSFGDDTAADWTRRMRRLLARPAGDVLLWGEMGRHWKPEDLKLLRDVLSEVNR
ncbi:MAG: hypothetical protein AAGF84_03740 [Planctomycetota bacterium]